MGQLDHNFVEESVKAKEDKVIVSARRLARKPPMCKERSSHFYFVAFCITNETGEVRWGKRGRSEVRVDRLHFRAALSSSIPRTGDAFTTETLNFSFLPLGLIRVSLRARPSRRGFSVAGKGLKKKRRRAARARGSMQFSSVEENDRHTSSFSPR